VPHGDPSPPEIWDMASGQLIKVLEDCAAVDVVFVDEATLACGGRNGVALYDTNTWTKLANLADPTAPDARVNAVCVSCGNEKLIAGQFDGSITVWDVKQRKLVATYRAHGHPIGSVAIADDGRTLVTATWRANRVDVWNLVCGELVASWSVSGRYSGATTISPNGQILCMGHWLNPVPARIWRIRRGPDTEGL